MARTDATLIGSYETVRLMEAAGVPVERMICVAGGERVRLSADVTVVGAAEPAQLRVVAHPDGPERRRRASAISVSRGRSSRSGWASCVTTSARR